MKKKLLYSFSLLLLSIVLHAQQTTQSQLALFEKVVPGAYTSTVGTGVFLGPLTGSARTYQMLIAASELTDLAGKNLTSISFRLSGSASAAWPASQATFNNYDIYLSGSVQPAVRSLTFANNVSGTQTLVRSGALVIPAGAFTFGSAPNAFTFDINFNTAYLYTGGNLLVEIRHSGSNLGTGVDALITSTAGYATVYSACWTGSYTGTAGAQGNFAVTKFKANDNLSNDDFGMGQFAVYPNPASDQIHIKSNIPVSALRVYNILGQQLMEIQQENLETIDISGLQTGTYLMRIESQIGTTTRKFIKQ